MKNFFKITALILALCAAMSLVACNDNQGTECTEHVDTNNDGVCDECGTEIEAGDENTETPAGPTKGNKVGNICHTYDLSLLFDEGKVNVEQYRGKVVVINFWGTWCGPCKSELPDFNKVASDFSDNVVVIAIHSSPSVGVYNPDQYDVTVKLPDSKIIFAVDQAMGSQDKYATLLGGSGAYPYTVVLDKDGIITYKHTGMMSYDELAAAVNDAKK